MNIGVMRHLIHIQAPTAATDAGGGKGEATWADITNGEVWAAIRPLRLEERYRAQQNGADVTHQVVIRYHSGVTRMHRILFGTRALHIATIETVDERNREHRLLCREAQ